LTQKVPKRSSQRQCFFAARGLCAANPTKPGLEIFCACVALSAASAKVPYALLPARPPSFCRISPEAAPLTGRKIKNYVIANEPACR